MTDRDIHCAGDQPEEQPAKYPWQVGYVKPSERCPECGDRIARISMSDRVINHCGNCGWEKVS